MESWHGSLPVGSQGWNVGKKGIFNIMKKMNKHIKNFLYGFLAWFIPFAASIPFYSKEGGLIIDLILFKTIMILIGSISAAFLLISYFKNISKNYIREGIVVGMVWFAIIITLDLLVLIPMSGMVVGVYFTQIGLRYLVMPVMSIMIGKILVNNN
jgi:hypothetical protein